jgi:enoyl-[acyl-carrier protein] reductase I
MGVANDRSIAWGIARVLHGQGAELAFSYQGGAFGRRAVPLAQGIGAKIIEEADVEDLKSVERIFDVIRKKWGSLDFVVHALAFSDRNELRGRYADTTRKNFEHTMVISCFSFTEICKLAADLMPSGGSLLTLTYGGATRVVPCYNVMGVGDERALSRFRFRPAKYPGECAVGGADAHIGRRRHLRRAHAAALSAAQRADAPLANAG